MIDIHNIDFTNYSWDDVFFYYCYYYYLIPLFKGFYPSKCFEEDKKQRTAKMLLVYVGSGEDTFFPLQRPMSAEFGFFWRNLC